jgi:hypothetical protein
VTTMIGRRSQFHQASLVASTNMANAKCRHAMNALVQQLTRAGLSLQGAHSHALARIDAAVQAYAAALAYIDTYGMLGIAVVFMFLLSFVLKRNDPNARRGSVSAH